MHHEQAFIGVVVAIGFFGVPMVWIVAHYSFLAWKQWHATGLVREMIQRGYTPQEIIQMMQVLGHRKKIKLSEISATTDVPPAKPVRQAAYSP
jgi:hypothetical protein